MGSPDASFPSIKDTQGPPTWAEEDAQEDLVAMEELHGGTVGTGGHLEKHGDSSDPSGQGTRPRRSKADEQETPGEAVGTGSVGTAGGGDPWGTASLRQGGGGVSVGADAFDGDVDRSGVSRGWGPAGTWAEEERMSRENSDWTRGPLSDMDGLGAHFSTFRLASSVGESGVPLSEDEPGLYADSGYRQTDMEEREQADEADSTDVGRVVDHVQDADGLEVVDTGGQELHMEQGEQVERGEAVRKQSAMPSSALTGDLSVLSLEAMVTQADMGETGGSDGSQSSGAPAEPAPDVDVSGAGPAKSSPPDPEQQKASLERAGGAGSSPTGESKGRAGNTDWLSGELEGLHSEQPTRHAGAHPSRGSDAGAPGDSAAPAASEGLPVQGASDVVFPPLGSVTWSERALEAADQALVSPLAPADKPAEPLGGEGHTTDGTGAGSQGVADRVASHSRASSASSDQTAWRNQCPPDLRLRGHRGHPLAVRRQARARVQAEARPRSSREWSDKAAAFHLPEGPHSPSTGHSGEDSPRPLRST